MKKKLSTIAILLSLSASLAFAGEKKDKSAGSDDSQPAVAAPGAEAGASGTEAGAAADQNPCDSSQSKKKTKKQNQQEPTDQEKQFDRVLMGIYG